MCHADLPVRPGKFFGPQRVEVKRFGKRKCQCPDHYDDVISTAYFSLFQVTLPPSPCLGLFTCSSFPIASPEHFSIFVAGCGRKNFALTRIIPLDSHTFFFLRKLFPDKMISIFHMYKKELGPIFFKKNALILNLSSHVTRSRW